MQVIQCFASLYRIETADEMFNLAISVSLVINIVQENTYTTFR